MNYEVGTAVDETLFPQVNFRRARLSFSSLRIHSLLGFCAYASLQQRIQSQSLPPTTAASKPSGPAWHSSKLTHGLAAVF